MTHPLDSPLGVIAALRVVDLLAHSDPVYDAMGCFHCGAAVPAPVEDRGSWWSADAEVHDTDCPWWLARSLCRLSDWPTSDEELTPTR